MNACIKLHSFRMLCDKFRPWEFLIDNSRSLLNYKIKPYLYRHFELLTLKTRFVVVKLEEKNVYHSEYVIIILYASSKRKKNKKYQPKINRNREKKNLIKNFCVHWLNYSSIKYTWHFLRWYMQMLRMSKKKEDE